jgi:hypothetical protein
MYNCGKRILKSFKTLLLFYHFESKVVAVDETKIPIYLNYEVKMKIKIEFF